MHLPKVFWIKSVIVPLGREEELLELLALLQRRAEAKPRILQMDWRMKVGTCNLLAPTKVYVLIKIQVLDPFLYGPTNEWQDTIIDKFTSQASQHALSPYGAVHSMSTTPSAVTRFTRTRSSGSTTTRMFLCTSLLVLPRSFLRFFRPACWLLAARD